MKSQGSVGYMKTKPNIGGKAGVNNNLQDRTGKNRSSVIEWWLRNASFLTKFRQASGTYGWARGDGSYMCIVCGNALNSQAALNQHVKTVHSDLSDCISYSCEICGKIVKTKPHLKRHVLTHNPPTVPCPICDKMFNHQKNVVRHIKTIHTFDEQKKYQCEICYICGESFPSMKLLGFHFKDHEKDVPCSVQCEICCKGFTAKTVLEDHMNWHNNLKPYKCQLCPNSYQNQSNLIAHQKIKHVNENTEGETECL